MTRVISDDQILIGFLTDSASGSANRFQPIILFNSTYGALRLLSCSYRFSGPIRPLCILDSMTISESIDH